MKGKSYRINIHICTYEKSEYRFSVKTGTSVIRSGIFPLKIREWKLQRRKHCGTPVRTYMTKVSFPALFLFLPDSKTRERISIFPDQRRPDHKYLNWKAELYLRRQFVNSLCRTVIIFPVLGRSIQSYTYISSQNRLVRLTNHDHIAEADWTESGNHFAKESSDYQGNIDDLFQAELYLISPITEPARFLKKEYFLTSAAGYPAPDLKETLHQPVRIFLFYRLPEQEKHCFSMISWNCPGVSRYAWFTGAMPEKNENTGHKRLQRIAFLSDNQLTENTELKHYSAILADEAHLLSSEKLQILLTQSEGSFL